MGPLEIAPGTQWDVWEGDPMFPPPALYSRYEAPRIGDISARSALGPEPRRHLHCRVVDRLEPIVQAHAIDGLLPTCARP